MVATVEQPIKTSRSFVSVDVYATEIVDGRQSIILCECKWWKRPIDQNAINAFRTVMNDHGANKGYVISKNGFFPAAHNSSNYTNIQLVDWETFLEEFEATWLKRFFIPTVTIQLDWLITMVEPGEPAWRNQLPKNAQKKLDMLRVRYAGLASLAMMLSEHMVLVGGEIPKLPLKHRLKTDIVADLPEKITNALGYRELLLEMLKAARKAESEFHAIRDKYVL